ncbi:MAG: hypothetical protein KDK10_07750 [Maritimibacter sp.]|nr:hypothetical protein [Maritimibacter sp.]
MVNAANIFDEESLRAWLKEQVNFISLQVASRSMLRLLPIWTAYTATEDARNRGVESLPVLRAFLATQIVPAYTSVHSATLLAAVAPNVRRITANLDNIFSVKNIAAMENLYGPGDHLETVASVSIVVLSAYAVGGREREEILAKEMARASIAFMVSAGLLPNRGVVDVVFDEDPNDYWAAVLSDVETGEKHQEPDLFHAKLWPETNPFQDRWDATRARWTPDSPYDFWRRWYESLLAGQPMAPDLLYRVATEIPNDTWDAGPEAVAEAIRAIEAEFFAAQVAYAEDLVYDAQANQYRSTPRSDLPASRLDDAVERLEDLVADLRRTIEGDGGNQYRALVSVADDLERVLQKRRGRAIRIHDGCLDALNDVIVLQTDGSLPGAGKDKFVDRVSSQLTRTSDDIYSFDPEVRETVDARAARNYDRLNDDQRVRIAGFAEAVAERSEPEMAEEIREDAEHLRDPEVRDQRPRTWRHRLGGRLVKVVAIGGPGLALVLDKIAYAEQAWGYFQMAWQAIKALVGL